MICAVCADFHHMSISWPFGI